LTCNSEISDSFLLLIPLLQALFCFSLLHGQFGAKSIYFKTTFIFKNQLNVVLCEKLDIARKLTMRRSRWRP
jgi:hypothetical protein